MGRIGTSVLCFVLLSGLCFANPVDEAKAKIEKKHHVMLVTKAQTLLEKQANLEKELASVKAKLDKLAAGEDVDVSEDAPACCYFVTSGGTVLQGGIYNGTNKN